MSSATLRFIAMLVGCALAHGCASEAPRESDSAGAWLLAIERAHERADQAPSAAREVLTEALERPVPSAVSTEHRRVVHQDLSFRIARAELTEKRFAQALAATDRGLALGRQPDLFASNLLVARGEALEGLGRRTEAAAAYFEALEINRKLLHDELPRQDAGAP